MTYVNKSLVVVKQYYDGKTGGLKVSENKKKPIAIKLMVKTAKS